MALSIGQSIENVDLLTFIDKYIRGIYRNVHTLRIASSGTVLVCEQQVRGRIYKPTALLVSDWTNDLGVAVKANNAPALVTELALEVKLSSLGSGIAVGATVPVNVSGSVTVQGTLTGNQGTPASTGNRWPVQITDGVTLLPVSTAGLVFAASLPVIFSPSDIGTLNVSQQGVVSGSLGTAQATSFAGNASLTPGASIVKSVLFIGTGAANKVLKLGANQISSKTAATSPAELLDREIAVPAATALSVANGVAGDTIIVTYLAIP